MGRLSLVVLGLVASAGCATTPKWAAATTMAEEKFPPRQELLAVAMRPPRLDTAKHDAVAVERWTLLGPFPLSAGVAMVKPTTPWELALQEVAPSLAGALSVDQQCIAREVARFFLERKSYPGNSLQAFIERRCGTTVPHVRLAGLSGEVPEGMSEAEWISQWKADLGKQAAALGGPDVAGLAVLREGTRAVMVLTSGELGANLEAPVPLVSPGATVVIRGRLARGGAERIEAVINKGALDVAQCKTLGALTPPAFAFECPVEAGDARTTLEVAVFDPGRNPRALGAQRAALAARRAARRLGAARWQGGGRARRVQREVPRRGQPAARSRGPLAAQPLEAPV